MAAKRPRPGKNEKRARPFAKSSTALRVREVPGQAAWELIHPPCARERSEDIEEVRRMVEAAEYEIAQDELRWLLNGCSDNVAAHRLLGELALLENDARLARGHFGYAFQIGMAAIERVKAAGPFTYERAANRDFLEAGKGLAHCLKELSKPKLARDVLQRLLKLDPADPLGAGEMMAKIEVA